MSITEKDLQQQEANILWADQALCDLTNGKGGLDGKIAHPNNKKISLEREIVIFASFNIARELITQLRIELNELHASQERERIYENELERVEDGTNPHCKNCLENNRQVHKALRKASELKRKRQQQKEKT